MQYTKGPQTVLVLWASCHTLWAQVGFATRNSEYARACSEILRQHQSILWTKSEYALSIFRHALETLSVLKRRVCCDMPNTLVFTKTPSAKTIQLNILNIIFNAVEYTQYVQKVLRECSNDMFSILEHTLSMLWGHAWRILRACSKFIRRKLRV